MTVEFLLFDSSHCSNQMLKISSTWINEGTNTPDHGFSHPFKRPRAVSNGLLGIKNASVKCLFIFNWRYFTTDKKLKDQGMATVGVVPSKLNFCRRIWLHNVFLVFVWGILSWSLSKHFRYTLYSDKPLRQNAPIIVSCTRYWPEGPHWTLYSPCGLVSV